MGRSGEHQQEKPPRAWIQGLSQEPGAPALTLRGGFVQKALPGKLHFRIFPLEKHKGWQGGSAAAWLNAELKTPTNFQLPHPPPSNSGAWAAPGNAFPRPLAVPSRLAEPRRWAERLGAGCGLPLVLKAKLQYLQTYGLTSVCVRMCFFSMLGFLQRIPHSSQTYFPLPRPRTYTYSSFDLYL